MDGYYSRKYSTLSLTCDLQFIVNHINVDTFFRTDKETRFKRRFKGLFYSGGCT